MRCGFRVAGCGLRVLVMNQVKIEKFGEIEAIKLGYGPVGPPFMSVYLYILDGLVIDTGQRHMQKAVIDLLAEKKLQQILLSPKNFSEILKL